MQYRRHEDYTIPSDPPVKLRDRRFESGHDHGPYAMSRRNFLKHSPCSRRSLSPRRVEGSRRLLSGDRRSNSLERRDYGWDLGGGRGERVHSRSPPLGLLQERPHYDKGISSRELSTAEFQRRYEFVEYVDLNDDEKPGLKPEYRYQHSAARLIREKDFDGTMLLGTRGHRISGQKSMVSEDDAVQGLSRFPADLVPTSKYGEGGASFLSSSRSLDTGRFRDERVRYTDSLLMDELSVMESYEEREKPMFYSKNVSYHRVPVSRSKDSIGTSQFMDFVGTSSGITRANFQGSYHDDMPFLTEESPRISAKCREPLGFTEYGQRSILDPGRDPNAKVKDLAYYQQDTFSPTRAEHWDYLNAKPRERESDDYGYPSEESYRRMGTREGLDYDHKDLSRPGVTSPIADRADNTEFTYGNTGDGSLWDHRSMKKKTVSNDFSLSISIASKGGEYLDSESAHVKFGRRALIDQEIPHLGVSKDHEISHLRLDYGFGRDAPPASHNEKMRNSPEFKFEAEMRRLPVRTQEINMEELGTYDSSDRALKRKYSVDEEMSRHNARSIMSGKWYNTSRPRDLNDRSKEWTVQDSGVSFSSRRLGYDKKLYKRAERTFVGEDHQRVSALEVRLPSHDHVPGRRHSKEHPRRGSPSSYSSYRFNRRLVLPKPHNVWIRGKDDNQVDLHENEADQSKDWVSSVKSEPPEDSEEFKQLVHKAFLMLSKKLNENPAVQKRYKEQGRAGSLFCIVCGRSLARDFMDTRRLVRHAFRSDKVGLRAQHLGLHKAICVLLGWNSVVSPNVIKWVPEAVSDSEAMAQKEDLILWPPVIIIHNSSITKERKVTTLESLGDFLRGKGFSGGKFKVSLGKSENHSIAVVKFLDTFSGLKDAERLHKYFVENKRGRADFERVASSSIKGRSSSNTGVGANQGHNIEELVLYGYMGIAEDLDKVDLDTKRKCSINSKKEIQDLANAPVKPE